MKWFCVSCLYAFLNSVASQVCAHFIICSAFSWFCVIAHCVCVFLCHFFAPLICFAFLEFLIFSRHYCCYCHGHHPRGKKKIEFHYLILFHFSLIWSQNFKSQTNDGNKFNFFLLYHAHRYLIFFFKASHF